MLDLKEQKIDLKGNIPVQEELLNKYANVEEIFEQINKYDMNLIIDTNIEILNNVNLNTLNIEEIKKLAILIFNNYHTTNCFINNGNRIFITKSGINESVQKAFYKRHQKEYLWEHLIIYSCLGKIIESAELISQVLERKGRNKYKCWNYYLNGVVIDDKEYLIEFEVAAMDNNENHYRIQRLNLIKQKTDERGGDVSI